MVISARFAVSLALLAATLSVVCPARSQVPNAAPVQFSPELRFCERRTALAGRVIDMKRRGLSAVDAFKGVEKLDPAHHEYLRKAVKHVWTRYSLGVYSQNGIAEEDVANYLDTVMINCMKESFPEPEPESEPEPKAKPGQAQ